MAYPKRGIVKDFSKEDEVAARLGSPLALHLQIDFHRDQIQEHQKKIRAIVDPILEKLFNDSSRLSVGVHDCENSPYRICTYDVWDDPKWDFCVFCNQPHTRK